MPADADTSPIYCFLDIQIGGKPIGRIICELFRNEVPKTVENFRALCTGETGKTADGFLKTYKGSQFHRVIKHFMIQASDYTRGDGTGGESIYGKTFEDESLVRKHDQEYLLSMANRGKNTNSSQFFITTVITGHLDGKHCVFGKVVSGQDVIKRIESTPTDDEDRPVEAVIISHCGQLERKSKKEAQVEKSKKKKKRASSRSGSSSSSSEEVRRRKKKRKSSKKQSSSSSSSSSDSEVDMPKRPSRTYGGFLDRGGRDMSQVFDRRSRPRSYGNHQDREDRRYRNDRDGRDGYERYKDRRHESHTERRSSDTSSVRTDSSGRKVKGRGLLKYNPYPSRSQRDRSPSLDKNKKEASS